MSREYLDFDVAISPQGQGYAAHVVSAPAGLASGPFVLPFGAAELARFMVAVGPPRVASRRLVPAAPRVLDVKEYGRRLGDALLAGAVGTAFRSSLELAVGQGADLRLRLRLDAVPELDPVPWEYLYDSTLERFLTLSRETPVVRVLDAIEVAPPVAVALPLRVLVMISSPTDLPELAVQREKQLLAGTTGDLVAAGLLEIEVIDGTGPRGRATLGALQKALIEEFNVLHFIGHGGFDEQRQEGVLALERDDGTADLVSGGRLGTLLHDAQAMQLAVLNACEGARTSTHHPFSGVGQSLVRQGLPAVVAMQTEISDRAALVFAHEFYWFLTRGLGIDAAMCEVRKAMATSDEAAEWGTAVLLRSGTDQPFTFPTAVAAPEPGREQRWASLYDAARGAIADRAPKTALPLLEQLAVERPDDHDLTALIERVRPEAEREDRVPTASRRPDAVAPPPERPSVVSSFASLPETTVMREPLPTGGAAAHPSAPDADVVEVEEHEVTEHRSGHRRGGRVLRTVSTVVVLVGLGLTAWAVVPGLVRGDGGRSVAQACGATAPATPSPRTSLTFGCATTAPVIDGDFADWVGPRAVLVAAQVFPAVAASSPGFAARWQGQWDAEALYLHATVTDPDLRSVSDARPAEYWKGDGISVELGPDVRRLDPGATTRRGADVHIMVGLSGSSPAGAVAAINPAARGTFVAGSAQPGITSARRELASGYELEVRLPWRLVTSQAPARGSVLGVNLVVSDATSASSGWALRRMISSNPHRVQSRPATWQTVLLADGPS